MQLIETGVLLVLLLAAAPAPARAQESDPRETSSDPWVRSLPDAEELSSGSLDSNVSDPPVNEDGTVPEDGTGATGSGGAGGSGADGGAGSGSSGSSATPVSAAETEPNDTFGAAQTVAVTSRVTGTIEPLRDTDWYVFDAERRGAIEIGFSTVPTGIAPAFRVHNAEGTALMSWIYPRLVGTASETTVVDLSSAGRYYVAVADDKHDSSSDSPYVLELTYHAGDRFEPNDTYGTATEVSADARVSGTILPKGETDRYAFEIGRRGSIEVEFPQVPDEILPAIRLHDAEGTALTSWTYPKLVDGGSETTVFDLKNAGVYHVAVADDKHDSRSWSPYTLHCRMHPGDADEPNETLGTATPVEPTSTRRASMLPMGDTDCYTFEVARRGTTTVSFEDVPEGLGLSLRMHNAERTALISWRTPSVRDGRTEPVVVDLPASGRYYLAVADDKHDTRSYETYTVRLEHDAGDVHEPNETIGTASTLSIGTPVRGNILPKGDTDGFAFDVGSARTVEVLLTRVPETLTPSLRIHDANRTALTSWTMPAVRNGATEPLTVELKQPGRYYVFLACSKHAERSVDEYELLVR